jgi:hypothetical protein
MNTATQGSLAVTAVTLERDSSHIFLGAQLLGLELLTWGQSRMLLPLVKVKGEGNGSSP